MPAMTRPLGLALLVSVSLAACSGYDSGTDPNPTDLSGNYTLTSYKLGDAPALTPPIATGSLTLTSTRYTVNLTIAGQPASDNGTYSISGNQITQSSDVFPIQTVGTWVRIGNLFTIDVTVPVQGRIISSWQKQ
jgi:hypothetical protein